MGYEIDKTLKRIEELWGNEFKDLLDEFHFEFMKLDASPVGIKIVAAWLFDQLKECREDNQALKRVLKAREIIEQRTKDACFEAGWAWIQDGFGEQFGYDPTDDADKEDFKQAIDEAKVE